MSHYLHIGCGPIHLSPPWINIDHESSHNPDLCIDVFDIGDHFPDESVAKVFSCHCLEHLPLERIPELLSKIHRALKPGGVLRLCVPDLGMVARKYVEGDDLKSIFVSPGGKFYVGDIDCPATRFLFFCRAWEHLWIPDEALMTKLLKDAGFSGIQKMPFGQSSHLELRGMDRFPEESLVYESTK